MSLYTLFEGIAYRPRDDPKEKDRSKTPMRSSVLLIVTVLLLIGPTIADELWRTPLTLEHQEVRVDLLNWELTRDRKTLLLHAKLQSVSKDPLYFDWRNFIKFETAEGKTFGPNFDALVDRNGAGLTRTVGEFRLIPREKARITIPFLLGEDELPARLVLPDGRRSVLVK